MNKLIFFLLIFLSFSVIGQIKKERQKSITKVGVLFSNAKQNNLFFFDKDYDYKTNVYKFQLFYPIKSGRNWDVNLILQPQFQKAQHQLLNEQFITPDEENFEFLREKFTQKKDISLYAFEVGFQLRKSIIKNIFFEATLGLGAGYISLESERLAKGFTFIENLSLGLAHKINKSEIFIATTVGHVSNFNIQKPNSGYNILGFELGYRVFIK
ncbi:acyloxyacyl hydrolase [Flavobacteriaceae bacterium]|nr:acyloxyacyl hydrolase [Flavobacteriaceae bacterium]